MDAIVSDHLSDLSGTRCPACQVDLCALPPSATFCPACRRRLRPERTVWAAACAVASLLWWGADAPPIDHRGPRAPVVVGYSNALWRLGWRYEHGRGAIRNMPEALRCYSKSAGLGNVEAAARIDSRGPEPAPVLPLQGEDGPLDVTD